MKHKLFWLTSVLLLLVGCSNDFIKEWEKINLPFSVDKISTIELVWNCENKAKEQIVGSKTILNNDKITSIYQVINKLPVSKKIFLNCEDSYSESLLITFNLDSSIYCVDYHIYDFMKCDISLNGEWHKCVANIIESILQEDLTT